MDMEISMIKDAKKLYYVFTLYKESVSEHIKTTDFIVNKALQYGSCSSLHDMDSLHIAAAEIGKADVFLTVDDRLIRSSKDLSLSVKILNPVDFLREG
ncbi:hypothetical protein D081_1579 [Anaerovibrio sp. JC8]|uniref:type II toxin-antitoxin system VapC family toxin n=1 Tax=Anaerovibrio sp. JC8 TaxID=1240085 RepID=UPI000A0AD792|nr:type II toxin-antitoxin system VapC family toxin [Anaerovibrio sp. JC8]ORT99998.1 hypothetical protein D081_1579 [Anaerovibrio sp. JC8]